MGELSWTTQPVNPVLSSNHLFNSWILFSAQFGPHNILLIKGRNRVPNPGELWQSIAANQPNKLIMFRLTFSGKDRRLAFMMRQTQWCNWIVKHYFWKLAIQLTPNRMELQTYTTSTSCIIQLRESTSLEVMSYCCLVSHFRSHPLLWGMDVWREAILWLGGLVIFPASLVYSQKPDLGKCFFCVLSFDCQHIAIRKSPLFSPSSQRRKKHFLGSALRAKTEEREREVI